MSTRTLRLLPLVALLLVGLAGCSDEQPAAPAPTKAPAATLSKTAGPGDLVFALDVSDGVDDATLAAMTAGLGAALADGDLVPADGSITVAALVYGDTIAAVFEGFVPVTAENLDATILPALAGLVDDRLVAGDGADLAGALDEAGVLLSGASADDQHVLVMGSAAASDTAAVQTACDALAGAGVTLSAAVSGVGDHLDACIDGGWFGAEITDWDAAAADALAYLLHADLELSGSAEQLARGEEFTATALFYRGRDPESFPLAGAEVAFAVVEGPQVGMPVLATTDETGRATFSFLGEGGPGTDVVVAQAAHPGTGRTLADTVRVTWENQAPTCDAGGPYAVTVLADTALVTLDASGSADADGDTLTYAWSLDCADASFDDATAVAPALTLTGACLCADTLTVTLTVDDGYATSTCETMVVLTDQRPPVVTVDGPLELWPPNHKFRAYTPDMFLHVADACGEPLGAEDMDVTVLEVRSDEPDDCQGDGRTIDDMRVDCPDVVHLRAERSGGGDGRVYTIVYRVTGSNGADTEVEAQVVVPHDQSGGSVHETADGGWTLVPDCDISSGDK